MYVFNADTFCDSCGAAIAHELERGNVVDNGDSDSFPQSVRESECDYPNHCGAGADCLEGIDLGEWGLDEVNGAPREAPAPLYGAEARVIGELLSDGLTEYGAGYLADMLADNANLTPYQTALHRFWREVFADELAGFEVSA